MACLDHTTSGSAIGIQKLPNMLEPPTFLRMKKGNKLLSVSAVAMTRVPCLVICVVMVTSLQEELKTQNLPSSAGVSLCGCLSDLERARKVARQPTSSVALTKATAMLQGLNVADALSEQSVLGLFLPYGLELASLPKTGDHWVLRLQVFPSPADTQGDTDFVAWVLRVAPECRNLHLHAPVEITLAIAFIS